jgi:hypothetical protein
MSDPFVYAAVAVSILASAVGLVVSGLVLRRLYLLRHFPRPAIALLLVSLAGLSLSNLMEQARVLVFRLSFDGFISGTYFTSTYAATWSVAGSKVLFAVSLIGAAAVKLGLYCDQEDSVVVQWVIVATAATFSLWVVMAWLLDLWYL